MISLLSFGGMRIPRITVKASINVIKRAYELGVNFYETSPGYGDSEHKIGLALKEIDRSKVFISTKSHPGTDKTAYEVRKRLDESLKRLDLEYVDFYQIWGINTKEHFDIVFNKDGYLDGIHQAMKEGLIQHIGFTTHAEPSLILDILNTNEFETVTLIYHLYHQKNEIPIQRAHELNMGVAVIAPLSNGFLAHPTEQMIDDFMPYNVREYSLHWLANDPRITTIISGMKTFKELEENYQSIVSFNSFSKLQIKKALDVHTKLRLRIGNQYCPECRECLPCPMNINIPELMRINNIWKAYHAEYYCKDRYKFMGNGGSWYPGVKANHCNDCGECEPRCSENLKIVSIIKLLHIDLYTGDRSTISNHT